MIKKNNKSKMTIDKLAMMVAKGFENVATKIDIQELKKDIEDVKDRLTSTNKRIDDFAETKVSKITYKELENRVQKIEVKI